MAMPSGCRAARGASAAAMLQGVAMGLLSRPRPPETPAHMRHPCLACGACCAHFRISFHWSEAEPGLGGTVPIELRSEEHTSELQSRENLVCRLLLEKKKEQTR